MDLPAPSTPPAAPYPSFSMDIEPLVNTSFFSHDDDDVADDRHGHYDHHDDDMDDEELSQELNEDEDEDEDDSTRNRIHHHHRRRRYHRSHPRYAHLSNNGDDEDDMDDNISDYEHDHDSSDLNIHEDHEDNNSSPTVAQTNRTTTPPTPASPAPSNDEEEEEEEDDDDDEYPNNEHPSHHHHDPRHPIILQATTTLPAQTSPHLREVGHENTIWSLSTAKPGNGVEQIRDLSTETYWQSDGGQPHLLNIQFIQRKSISLICFYLDYSLDESYTPKKLSVRVGMTFHDLEEVRVVQLNEPVGWISIPLWAKLDPLEEEGEDNYDDDDQSHNTTDEDEMLWGTTHSKDENDRIIHRKHNKEFKKALERPIRAHFIQICVVSMHQNGKDTHIRQVKLFGPRTENQLHFIGRNRRNSYQVAESLDKTASTAGITTKPKITSFHQYTTDNNENDKRNDRSNYLFDGGFIHKFKTVEMTQFNTIR